MKKPIVRQRQNSGLLKHRGELNTLPSLTVPDDSYSVRDILERFTRGIDPMLTRLGEYEREENDSLDEAEFQMNPIRMINDLSDITELEYFLEKTEQNKKILIDRITEQKRLNEEKLNTANKLASEQ